MNLNLSHLKYSWITINDSNSFIDNIYGFVLLDNKAYVIVRVFDNKWTAKHHSIVLNEYKDLIEIINDDIDEVIVEFKDYTRKAYIKRYTDENDDLYQWEIIIDESQLVLTRKDWTNKYDTIAELADKEAALTCLRNEKVRWSKILDVAKALRDGSADDIVKGYEQELLQNNDLDYYFWTPVAENGKNIEMLEYQLRSLDAALDDILNRD